MCFIELEPCTVWDETKVTARKQHKCSCCASQIEKGHSYYKHFSIFERQITSEKICLHCYEDRAEFADAHDGSLMRPGDFFQMLIECISEEGVDDSDEEISKWLPMKQKLEARMEAAKDQQC